MNNGSSQPTQGNDEVTKVRRIKSGNGWCVSDNSNTYFVGGFRTGLLQNVEFVHDAPPMTCERGYDSTGEAQGVLVADDDTAREPIVMPTVSRTASVVYDRSRRVFHVDGKPTEKIDRADFLLLEDNGKATVGWLAATQEEAVPASAR